MQPPAAVRRVLFTAVALALLYPLYGLFAPVGSWQWHGHHAFASLRVSFALTLVALAIVVLIGTPLAWSLKHASRKERTAFDAIILLSVLMPPLALGLLLALAFGPSTAIGRLLLSMNIPTSNSDASFIVTQMYASLGYYVIGATAAFEAVPADLEQSAALLGLKPWRIFRRITLPLARLGLAGALSLAWVRALGEFGAIMVTSYYPHGMPVQLWVNLQDSGLPAVLPLLVLFLATALPLPWILHLRMRRHRYA
ncbi:MAG: ABC transporter permease subunit [Gammaproteobacteria bacterium]|nr:ABC transporter permease subunit [Gammaproteobacteria bacterium]